LDLRGKIVEFRFKGGMKINSPRHLATMR
jgi:hypothetical protein